MSKNKNKNLNTSKKNDSDHISISDIEASVKRGRESSSVEASELIKRPHVITPGLSPNTQSSLSERNTLRGEGAPGFRGPPPNTSAPATPGGGGGFWGGQRQLQ